MATKGRASFLRERSIGHLDPGACSSSLLVHAACDALLEPKKP
jgi:dihydroxyacetone kinase-like protein